MNITNKFNIGDKVIVYSGRVSAVVIGVNAACFNEDYSEVEKWDYNILHEHSDGYREVSHHVSEEYIILK